MTIGEVNCAECAAGKCHGHMCDGPRCRCTQQPVCGSCEAPVSEEMDRTIRRLLGSLDQARHDCLATLHGGTAPDVLCSTCFLPTIGTLNRTLNGTRA